MIFPYFVDVPMVRWPIANFIMLGLMFTTYILQNMIPVDGWIPFVLKDWSGYGLLGYVWLHGGLLHLLGNMLFLWVFGNAICAKIGGIQYAAVYIFLGVVSGISHLIISGQPVIGASGAINGIVGMYLVFYPLNTVRCFILFVRAGTFEVGSIWMILFWLAFDIWGAFSEGGHTAYWAHLGGFFVGVALAVTALLTGYVVMSDREKSLLQIMGLQPKAEQ